MESVARVKTVIESTKKKVIQFKLEDMVRNIFGEVHIPAMNYIVDKESGFNKFAVNPSSGAAGLFQALPASKLPCQLEDVDCQLRWGVEYVKDRYGNPIRAWEFWKTHNWY